MFDNTTTLVKFHFYENKDDKSPYRSTERELFNVPAEYAYFDDSKYKIFESCYYDGKYGGKHYYILKLLEIDE